MNPDYNTVRRLIEGRFRRRIVLGLHFVLFTGAVAVTAVWMLTHQVYQGDLKNLWFLVGWAVVLFLHWLAYTLATGGALAAGALYAAINLTQRAGLPVPAAPPEALPAALVLGTIGALVGGGVATAILRIERREASSRHALTSATSGLAEAASFDAQ